MEQEFLEKIEALHEKGMLEYSNLESLYVKSFFLNCHLITVGTWLDLTMIAPNHCWFLARTGSDKWPITHCWCKPQTGSDSDVVLHYRFYPSPNHFLIFKLRTGSESTSLPVLTNPAEMRPAVMSKSVVVTNPRV